ncbi:MAG: hypothetical protein PHQ47_03705 [Candidatus Portnoybacteria bacterium]|nr:hypothetical protein [Candidatus Portnoybacteria bacterium]
MKIARNGVECCRRFYEIKAGPDGRPGFFRGTCQYRACIGCGQPLPEDNLTQWQRDRVRDQRIAANAPATIMGVT